MGRQYPDVARIVLSNQQTPSWWGSIPYLGKPVLMSLEAAGRAGTPTGTLLTSAS